ncbi:srs domain-containing protein [Neospora caninum Liverpool]|uniref:Srs domain-containing protein n=1 Tax=Neospora caninum (strain Liverpool) TaxID=572307 RepID=F0VA36_NEOCL|nr:srs domain-containing protein [Neospora caninum Liverpool]CBZ50525.1 srs domain-containing protein [Neospora caninum Liverpool]CEL65135.1 TPA: SRS domain-containing protein [Neospora caninum Liverpool]|eukprot:XP_003880558.1 srs domain-containing protein [Neospora caninum Liverpool]
MARMGKTLQRRRGSNPMDLTWMAACMIGILLFCSREVVAAQLSEGLQHRRLQTKFTTVAPTFGDAVATCNLTGAPAAASTPAATSLTLSQKSLTATLVCTGTQLVTVPASLVYVCGPKRSDEDTTCQFDGTTADGKEVKLKDFLGADRDVKWAETQQEQSKEPKAASTKTWTLQLEEADLPLSDKSFLVGCQETTAPAPANRNACKVTVTVEARASSVGDRNVVTCAYGKNSNPEPLKVEMTTENNTLTLQCGSEGILHPTTYRTRYCDPEAPNFQECNQKDYTGILPGFVESWWTNADTESSATLTIPETEFPESNQQFRLSCVPNAADSSGSDDTAKTSKGGANDGSQTVAATSNCNVIVTVRSGSSASSTGQMVATVSGTAALIGLLVASL